MFIDVSSSQCTFAVQRGNDSPQPGAFINLYVGFLVVTGNASTASIRSRNGAFEQRKG